ncbi:MAG: zinc metallopeptidase [Bacteroidota bacterium]
MLLIIIVGFMIVSFAVSSTLKRKFKKYSQIPLNANLSGAQAAELMLVDYGIRDVRIVSVPGQLTDHYNPATKTVNLSEEVYHGRNAAAVAVATHECGHAVQHATAYSMLEMRSALVPLQNVSARIINIIFIAMFVGAFALPQIIPFNLALIVIISCYAIFTLFAVVTLPVEFDASKRALSWVQERGIVTDREHWMAKDALKWAAMTYVVAALSSLVMLLYYLSLLTGND